MEFKNQPCLMSPILNSTKALKISPIKDFEINTIVVKKHLKYTNRDINTNRTNRTNSSGHKSQSHQESLDGIDQSNI